jgi:hypothetical protein
MSTNYYLGPQRGGPLNVNRVVAGTSTAGSSVDFEVRLQIVNGATPTGLTRKDSIMLLKIIEAFIDGGGNRHGVGTRTVRGTTIILVFAIGRRGNSRPEPIPSKGRTRPLKSFCRLRQSPLG